MDDVSRSIGQLEGKMDRAIDMLKSMEGHMDALDQRLTKTEALSHATHKHITEDVKPVIEEVKSFKNRGMGFLLMAGIVWSFLTAGVVMVKDRILSAIFGA